MPTRVQAADVCGDLGRGLEHLLTPDLISRIPPGKAQLEEVMAATVLTSLSTSPSVWGSQLQPSAAQMRFRNLCSVMVRVQNFCYSRILKPPSLSMGQAMLPNLVCHFLSLSRVL